MSIVNQSYWFRRAAIALVLSAAFAVTVQAQALSATIRVLSVSPARVSVAGQLDQASRIWSFRKSYAGVMDLGRRVENLELEDRGGRSVPVRRLAPGEYEAATPAPKFHYEIRLEPPVQPSDAAYLSWLASDRGLFVLGDLLPGPVSDGFESQKADRIKFVLPGWEVVSDESRNAADEFEVGDVSRAVFFAGANLRQSHQRIGSMDFRLVATGNWAFSDRDALDLAARIIRTYSDLFRGLPGARAMLVLTPFPVAAPADRWSAETRGSTTTLLLGRQPSKTAALAQLSVPLAHEFFHLWIPNGLALEGDYAWFYEGFTLYQAARTAVRLELLSFEDFLNAIGRAFDVYLAAPDHDRLSLIDASKRRWTSGESLMYQKGMLVGLLYDLTLRNLSRGKSSLDDVYRELFHEYGTSAQRTDGSGANANRAAIAALSNARGMQDFTRRFVENPAAIDFHALAPFGLRVERLGARTHVFVGEPLHSRQRDLLRAFGYNK